MKKSQCDTMMHTESILLKITGRIDIMDNMMWHKFPPYTHTHKHTQTHTYVYQREHFFKDVDVASDRHTDLLCDLIGFVQSTFSDRSAVRNIERENRVLLRII